MNPNDLITKADLSEFEKRLFDHLAGRGHKDIPCTTRYLDVANDKLLTRKELLQFLNVSENHFKAHLESFIPKIPMGKCARYNKELVLKSLQNQNQFNL